MLIVGGRLLRVGGRIWIAHEVSRGGKSRTKWLLSSLCLSLLASLGGEDGIRKSRGCGRVGSIIESGAIIIEVQIEPAVIIAFHVEVDRARVELRG